MELLKRIFLALIGCVFIQLGAWILYKSDSSALRSLPIAVRMLGAIVFLPGTIANFAADRAGLRAVSLDVTFWTVQLLFWFCVMFGLASIVRWNRRELKSHQVIKMVSV
jgi:hypothetical protein